MEITIKIDGQDTSVEVSVEVYAYLDEARHKEENLAHEQRRHWDGRECDEYIISTEGSLPQPETPEEIICRHALHHELMSVLDTCTKVQRERFLLYALHDLSCAEIGRIQSCSRESVRESIEAVRKKYQKYFADHPDI